jgi:hypothetical protein
LIFPFFWRKRRGFASAEDRLGRLRKVLDRLDVEYHRQDPEAALRGIPPTAPPGSTTLAKPQRLHLPLELPGPIALLDEGFEAERNMREFRSTDIESARHYRPRTLVVPLGTAISIADRKMRGLLDFPSLDAAMVVLTRLDDSPLAWHHRDLLWRAMGVPVFEQMRGWDGTVIAWECEVHDGLHIVESAAITDICDEELLVTQLTAIGKPIVRARTGLTADIVKEHCECGKESPRLRNVMPMRMKMEAAASGR